MVAIFVAGIGATTIIVSRSSIDFPLLRLVLFLVADLVDFTLISCSFYHLTICVAVTLACKHVHCVSDLVIVALFAVPFHFRLCRFILRFGCSFAGSSMWYVFKPTPPRYLCVCLYLYAFWYLRFLPYHVCFVILIFASNFEFRLPVFIRSFFATTTFSSYSPHFVCVRICWYIFSAGIIYSHTSHSHTEHIYKLSLLLHRFEM